MDETPEWSDAVRRLQWHLYSRDVEPCRTDLRAYCLSLTGFHAAADDLVQETLVKGFFLVSQLHRGMDNPRSYLVRAATNLWIDWCRKPGFAVAEDRLHSSEQPDSTLLGAELDNAVQVLRDSLRGAELRAFVLLDLYGFTAREAAIALGKTPAAVKMAASRARCKMRAAEAFAAAAPDPDCDNSQEPSAMGGIRGTH